MKMILSIVFLMGIALSSGRGATTFNNNYENIREVGMGMTLFLFFNDTTNAHVEYGAAETYCRSLGGLLAMPKTKSINELLARTCIDLNLSMPTRPWIGLDNIRGGGFQWVDGTDFDPSVFDGWAIDQGPYNPRLVNGTCTTLTFNGKWFDDIWRRSEDTPEKVSSFVCQLFMDK